MSSPVKSVFVVQHSYEQDGCGETKFIGVYTTRQAAEDAIRRLQVTPGFRDHPAEFSVDEFPLDLDSLDRRLRYIGECLSDRKKERHGRQNTKMKPPSMVSAVPVTKWLLSADHW